jgi:hypothetical protein
MCVGQAFVAARFGGAFLWMYAVPAMSEQLREQRTVQVRDEPQDVQLCRKSKSLWIAVGQYMGRMIEVQDRP